jgi:putative tryptophan/tyrosine transport system substrate-binding protein
MNGSKQASMGIRTIVVLLIGLALASVRLADAQQTNKVPRIGFLGAGTASTLAGRLDALRQGLRDLGYIEGKNIAIEYRFADGKLDQIPRNAAELVRLKVDIIITGGPTDTRAAKGVTSTIPIVMTNEGDPVGTGVVSSLARPGGNITGLTPLAPGLNGKRVELLKETLPRLSSVFVLRVPGNPRSAVALKETKVAARSLGIKLQIQEVKQADDLNRAFEAITKARSDALTVVAGPFGFANRKRIVEFAANNRLPAIYYRREFVEDGGLMSYDANPNDLARRAATYVDKILKGAKPADLPVERPTKFELVINLETAKQIGLTIPPNMLARADKVIK